MRFIIQRVRHASVTIDGEVRGKIGKGFMVLIGIGADDTKEIADKLVRKLVIMRIFEDAEGRTILVERCGRRTFAYFPVYPLCGLQEGQPSVIYKGGLRRRWQSRWSNISLRSAKRRFRSLSRENLVQT